jgi:hypothetical protein
VTTLDLTVAYHLIQEGMKKIEVVNNVHDFVSNE